MAAETFPGPCLWCGARGYVSNLSHIVPAAVGNTDHTLPPGEVCAQCNARFGRDIEPTLLDDPFVHIAAVVRRVGNARRPGPFRDELFDSTHPPANGVAWELNLDVKLGANIGYFDVDLRVRGQITREYDTRRLAFLSRALHKIGLEHVAYAHRGGTLPSELDPRTERFDPARRWAREGQPQRPVRPVMRRPGTSAGAEWTAEVWEHGQEVIVAIELFGDWYGVNLTADSAVAGASLSALAAPAGDIWLMSDSIHEIRRDRG